MLRKHQSLLLLVSLSAASATFANHLFEGVYGHLGVGALNATAKVNSSSSATFANAVGLGLGAFGTDTDILSANQNAHKNKTSAMGALAIGYGEFLSSEFHLAGEIFANVAHRDNTLNNNVLSSSTSDNNQSLNTFTTAELRHWEFGADILPGYLFDQKSMIYARIGAAFNKQSVEANTLFSYTSTLDEPADGTYNSTLNTTDSKNRVGLRLGLGFEHAICPNLSATLDYIYTYYPRKSLTGAADITSVASVGGNTTDITVTPNGLATQVSSRVNTQAAMIGVKWYFL